MAAWDHPGGPWEQQKGFEVVFYRILLDFGVLLGPVYISFLISRKLNLHFVVGLVCGPFFLSISESKYRGLRSEGIAKIDLSWKSFLMNSGVDWCCFLEASGPVFLVFWALKTDLKIEDFLEM